MARKVIIGGFGSCEKQIKTVTQELSEFYEEEVEGISLRQAEADRGLLERMVKGATAIPHSGGFEAMRGMEPSEILAIAAPLRAPARKTIKGAIVSGRDLLATQCETDEERDKIARCGANLMVELVRHPRANFSRIGAFATFDAIDAAIAAKDSGIDVALGQMERDRLFQPTEEDLNKAEGAGLVVVTLDGPHEEFMYRPVKVMDELGAKLARASRQLATVALSS